MVTIATDTVHAYTLHRLEQGAAPASVNRELAIIRRAFLARGEGWHVDREAARVDARGG